LVAADLPTLNQSTSGSAGSVANSVTFASTGGAASGTSYNGSTARTIDYSTVGASPLAGSTSLTTVGTITGGTWNGTLISGQYGGTGVNNSGKTITLGGNLTTSGAFATTLTTTAATNVTLPITGTLATLAGAETFTNKTLTSPTFNGTPSLPTGTTGVTQLANDNSTKLATTAFVTSSVSAGAPDATTTATGKVQLAGDLAGINSSALAPVITNSAISTEKLASNAVTTVKIDDNAITTEKIKNGEILNADISSSAAISDTKLATISTIGKVSNSATSASAMTTPNTIVLRNDNGNFKANLITAEGRFDGPLTGNVTGDLTGNVTGNVSGTALNVTGIIASVNGGTGVSNSGKTITLGGNLTTSGAFATTLTTTAATNVTLPISGTLATLTGTETLTNKSLTSPTLVTPTIGVATATSVNKVTITAPTTSATLTIANGKTLTSNNSLIFAGTDATTMTFPSTNATIARTDAAQTFTGTQTFSSTIAGSITGNAATVTTNANLTGDVTSVGNASTVVKINGTSLAGLSTGILKNTTATGVPTIAIAGTDYLAPNGSATSLTGLPLTTGITGTLALANGGTGASTAAGALTNLGAAALASPTFTGTVTIPTLSVSGEAGIGITPTANLHIKAGTATANTAPIKLTAGTNLTTAEAGAIEFDGTNLYFTNASNVRQTIATVSSSLPQDVIDEFSSASGVTGTLTDGKTSFSLSQTPNAKIKVKMLINGIFISTTAYSLNGSTITYTSSNNGSKTIATTDRVQFFYAY
jgi:hypothetical protein